MPAATIGDPLDLRQLAAGDVVVYGPIGLARVERVDAAQREFVLTLGESSILVPFDSEAARFLRRPVDADGARACLAALAEQSPDPRTVVERLPHLKHTSERGSLLEQSETLGQLYAAQHTPGMPDVETQTHFAGLMGRKVFEEIGYALGRSYEELHAEASEAFAKRGARVPIELPLYTPPQWPRLSSDAPKMEGHRLLGSFLATDLLLIGDPLQMDQRPGEVAPGSDNVMFVAPVPAIAGIWYAYVRLGTDGSLQALALVHQSRAGDLLRIARRAERTAVFGVGSARLSVLDAGVVGDPRVHECLRYANPTIYPWGIVHETRGTGAHLVFTAAETAGISYVEVFLARSH